MLILVTGGAGYVGSVLVPALLSQGHRVRVLDRLRGSGQGLLLCCSHPGFAFVHGDVCDEPTVASALDGVEVVVHLAAIVGYPACQRDPDLATTTNVAGTKLLLGCADPTRKAEAEELVLHAGNAVVYRYATAFESGFRRTFIHVHDMARSVIFAVSEWDSLADGLYNVGDESMNLTKVELAERIGRHVDCRLRFDEFAADADQRDYEVSYRKIRAKGFRPSVDLDQGIAQVDAARLMWDRGG